MTKTENNILLFSITLCWAASYLFIKNLPENFSSYAYLTMTCGIAALIMGAVFIKRLRMIKKSTLLKGLLLSVVLTVNLLTEKAGISLLDPSNASFLAAMTIIIVPLLQLFFHCRPSWNYVAGTAIIIIGLCVSSGFAVSGFYNKGSLYMVGTCISSAVYTIAVDKYAKEEDPLLICIVQMIFTALTGFFLWYREDPRTFFGIVYTRQLLSNLFILAFFAKAYAYIVLMFSQKYTDALSVTVIASTEPVITLLLSLLLPAAYGGEHSLKLTAAAGACFIAIGAIVAGISFPRGNRKYKGHRKKIPFGKEKPCIQAE